MQQPKTRMLLGAALTAATLLAGAQSANATFVLGIGNPGNAGTDNVIINACTGNTLGPASLVQGCLNTSHTTLVDVSTSGGGNLVANGGQARFDASGGNLGNFMVNLDDPTMGFSKIIFNIDAQNGTSSNLSFTVNAVDSFGNTELPQLFSSTLSGNGQNFFSLTSTDGEVAASVSVTSSLSNIVDIQQVRLGGVGDLPVCTGPGPCGGPGPGPVPEPATLFLLGSALLGYGAMRRRQQRS